MALTNAAIKAALTQAKIYKLYDEKGLFMLVKPTGGQLWRLKYRFGGKECKIACNNDPLRGVFRVQFRPPMSCCASVLPFGLDRPGRAGGDDWRGQDRRYTAGLF